MPNTGYVAGNWGAEYFFDKAFEFDRVAEVLQGLCGEKGFPGDQTGR
ncbi:MAG: hypothetical protein AB2L13_13525 [Spirochaetota bacterium]